MKVAVQISGEFRMIHLTFDKLVQNILTIPGIEADIFIHTWRREESGLGTFPWAERGNWHSSMIVYSHGQGLNVYKPRSYALEYYDLQEDLKKYPRSMSMYYSIKEVNRVRKEYEKMMEIQYDLVVRYRTDCVIEECPFIACKELIQSRKSFLCIPKAKRCKGCDGPCEDSICDWFAFGTPDTMDVYCSTYDSWLNQTEIPIPESMLSMHLQLNRIEIQRPTIDFYLVEGNGSIRCV